MKTLREFHELWGKALDAIERKATNEQQAKDAQQAAARALGNAENARIAADKTKAEADAHVRARKAEQEKHDAEAYGVWARERAQHLAWIENAKGQVNAASEALEAINRAIGEKRAEHETLTAEIGQMKAKLTDAAAKF